MADPATPRLTPGELPSVRNGSALTHLQAAFGNLILAGTHFMTANQERHDAMTEQLCDDIQKLMRQVTK